MDLLRAFRGKKDDPQSIVDQAKERASLLKNISRAIKEVQLHHATLTSGQTVKDCKATLQLCASFESALRHGLKSSLFGQAGSFWPVALKISRKQAIEYINTLQFAQSENGRCRAWIRLAVNESSLESYLSVLLHDVTLLSKYYEPYSFLKDEETAGALQQLLAGLSQVTFSISVDTASLEFEVAPSAIQPVVVYPALSLVPSQGGGAITTLHQPSLNSKQMLTEGQDRRQPPSPSDSGGGGDSGGGDGGSGEPKKSPSSSKEQQGQQQFQSEHEHPVPKRQSVQHPESGGVGGDGDGGGGDSGSGDGGSGGLSLDSIPSDDGGSGGDADRGNHFNRPSDAVGIVVEGGSNTLMAVTDSSSGSSAAGLITMESIDGGTPEHTNGSLLKGEGPGYEVFSLSPTDKPTTQLLERAEVGAGSSSVGAGPSSVGAGLSPKLAMESSPEQVQVMGVGCSPVQGVVGGSSPKQLANGERGDMSPPAPETCVAAEEVVAIPPQSLAGGVVQGDPKALCTCAGAEQALGREEEPDTGALQVDVCGAVMKGAGLAPDGTSIEAVVESQTQALVGDLSPKSEFEPVVRNRSGCFVGDDTGHVQIAGQGPGCNLVVRSRSNCIVDVDTEEQDSHTAGLGPRRKSPPVVLRSVVAAPQQEDLVLITGAARDKPRSSVDLSESMVLIGSSYSPPRTINHPSMSGSNGDMRDSITGSDEDNLTLDLNSDHFSQELDVAKLEQMIKVLKEEIRHSDSPEKKDRLVTYQIKLQQLRDSEAVNTALGHILCRQAPGQVISKGYMCDGCGNQVRGVRRAWYRCSSCLLCVHEECLKLLSRPCSITVKDTEYILELCPEKGLTSQRFRCDQCNKHLDPLAADMRICDYSGLWYCSECHHGEMTVIPARVIHNWDFRHYKVCCRCAIVLARMYHKRLLSIKALNDKLYSYVDDLTTVEAIRDGMCLMKKYIVQCRLAKEEGLCEVLDSLLPAKVGNEFYSLCDLVELQKGVLVKQLQESHALFSKHIKDCPICSGKGYYCMYCKAEELLFPFDRNVECCQNCKTVSHKECISKSRECPNCIRIKQIAQRIK